MTDLRKAAEMALESMLAVLCDPEGVPCFYGSDGDRKEIENSIAALKEALAKDTSLMDRVEAYLDEKLSPSIQKTIAENAHLADGDDCTLIHLVRAIGAHVGRELSSKP